MSRFEKIEHCEAIAKGANDGSLSFPQIIATMREHGIERFHNDIVNGLRVFYAKDGVITQTAAHHHRGQPETLDADAVQNAITEIQAEHIDHKQFVAHIVEAGCVGYLVSATGGKTVYYGRDLTMHVESF